MTDKTITISLKISMPTGSGLELSGPITEAQKEAICRILIAGEPAPASDPASKGDK